ncbi:MAG: hypothetical protein LV473_03540 [Nitrospira sp.]|nr:hypothetical protein [Nitrospira sp.]
MTAIAADDGSAVSVEETTMNVESRQISETMRRLNMGCGPHRMPGWLNADIHRGPGIEEVVPCYVFLASQDVSYMTRQSSPPNGGTVVNG